MYDCEEIERATCLSRSGFFEYVTTGSTLDTLLRAYSKLGGSEESF